MWHCFAVGDVGDAVLSVGGVYSVPEYGQCRVHDAHGEDVYVVYVEWLEWLDDVYVVCGHSGVKVFGEAVWHACAQVVCDVLGAVYGEWSGVAVSERGYVAVWSEVVDASDVVVVAVCNQQGVQRGRSGSQYLLAEVGTAVDEDVGARGFDECGCAESVVARVVRCAYGAVASDLGYSGGCPCAE